MHLVSLLGITDSISPEYNPERYIEDQKVFIFTKELTEQLVLLFDVYPQTRQELPVLWEKINYLVGMCYPNWTDSPYSTSNQFLTTGPITNLTIGEMYTMKHQDI